MALETPTSLVEQHDVPGATLALCSADGVVTRSIGWHDRTRAARLSAAARFPIYSIAKTMIAAIVLQLSEEDRLTLEMPLREVVEDHAPWLDPAISIRQTLNHTSGLPDYGSLPAYREALLACPEDSWSERDFLACAREAGPRFAPGAGWAYSNTGYMLLRLAIETATGMSFAEAVAARIAAPLGLQQTGVVEDLAAMRGLTPGFSVTLSHDGTEEDITPRYHPGWVAHGLVASTAAETARFLHALLNGSLLAPPSLAAMLTPVRVPVAGHPVFRQPCYGLGVMLDPEAEGGLLVGHGGGGPGFSLGVLGLVRDGQAITAVGMANSDRGDIGLALAARELRRMTPIDR